jgi:predicted kinase
VKNLILTVGLPQSGKTTWTRSQGDPIVNPDSIRLALHGKPFIGLAEPFVWAIAHVMVRALFLAGHETVILDATNTTKKRRDEWKSESWTRSFVQIDAPPAVCKQRAAKTAVDQDHADGLIAAIDRMQEKFEPLTSEELGECRIPAK